MRRRCEAALGQVTEVGPDDFPRNRTAFCGQTVGIRTIKDKAGSEHGYCAPHKAIVQAQVDRADGRLRAISDGQDDRRSELEDARPEMRRNFR